MSTRRMPQAGSVCGRWQSSVSTMGSASSARCSSACWTPRSAEACRQSCAQSSTRKRTASGFIILATTIKVKLNIMAVRRPISRRSRFLYSEKLVRSTSAQSFAGRFAPHFNAIYLIFLLLLSYSWAFVL